MWYIYTTEYYSATKKNEIMSFAATKIQLEIIIPSEISQKQKDKYHMITPICGIQNTAQMNLSTQQRQTHRHREQTHGYKRGGPWGRDRLGVCAQQMQTITYRMDEERGPNVQHKELYSISWDKPQWKRTEKRTYVCV